MIPTDKIRRKMRITVSIIRSVGQFVYGNNSDNLFLRKTCLIISYTHSEQYVHVSCI